MRAPSATRIRILSAGVGALLVVTSCGQTDATLGTSVAQPLPGVRNEALTAASERTGIPRETLMALAYQQGRFEPAVPHVEEGPGDPNVAHKVDEHCPLAHLEFCADALTRWLAPAMCENP